MFTPQPADVDRFFHGLAEYAFHTRLGVVDPPIVDYVADLLVRFVRQGPLVTPPVRFGSTAASDLVEAAEAGAGRDAVAACRRIGDLALFWSGLYPEALRSGPVAPFEQVCETGRRAYRMASELEPADAEAERLLFVHLSHEYDVCVAGLGEVRRAWGEG